MMYTCCDANASAVLVTPRGVTSRRLPVLHPQYSRTLLEERFWAKVDRNGPVPECAPDLGSCWLWIAATTYQGYGVFTVKMADGTWKRQPAHRVSWELFCGPIPKGAVLDHLCRVKACIRPEHLDVVDVQTNTLRGVGPTSANARKTHCLHGHSEWMPDGRRDGWRDCRACKRIKNRERRARARLARDGGAA